MNPWAILGIAPTGDLAAIRRAYSALTRDVHPEDDPEGFRRLHEAYQAAMAEARGVVSEVGEPPARFTLPEPPEETAAFDFEALIAEGLAQHRLEREETVELLRAMERRCLDPVARRDTGGWRLLTGSEAFQAVRYRTEFIRTFNLFIQEREGLTPGVVAILYEAFDFHRVPWEELGEELRQVRSYLQGGLPRGYGDGESLRQRLASTLFPLRAGLRRMVLGGRLSVGQLLIALAALLAAGTILLLRGRWGVSCLVLLAGLFLVGRESIKLGDLPGARAACHGRMSLLWILLRPPAMVYYLRNIRLLDGEVPLGAVVLAAVTTVGAAGLALAVAAGYTGYMGVWLLVVIISLFLVLAAVRLGSPAAFTLGVIWLLLFSAICLVPRYGGSVTAALLVTAILALILLLAPGRTEAGVRAWRVLVGGALLIAAGAMALAALLPGLDGPAGLPALAGVYGVMGLYGVCQFRWGGEY